MLSFVDNVKDDVTEKLGGHVEHVDHKPSSPSPPSSSSSHPSRRFSFSQTPDQSGKVAIVTLDTEGIGYGVIHTLLKHSIKKVYVLYTSEDLIRDAHAAVTKALGEEIAGRAVVLRCDMGDWQQVKTIAEKIGRESDRLDIVFNNTARRVMKYQLTREGVEKQMATNHMGHVLLTSLLLPLMKKTAKSDATTVRIVNLSGPLHHDVPSDLRFESLEELNQDVGPAKQCGRSKLAAILYARWFDRMVTQAGYPNLIMNATHPGLVGSALSTVYAATMTTESGKYIDSPAVDKPGSEFSQDEELGERLMKLTRKVLMDKLGGELELY